MGALYAWGVCRLGVFAVCLASRRPAAAARPSPNVKCSAELNKYKKGVFINYVDTFLDLFDPLFLLMH